MIETKQLDLISSIYDGITAPRFWPDLLQECAHDVGARSCILASANVVMPEEFMITAYSRHFARRCIPPTGG